MKGIFRSISCKCNSPCITLFSLFCLSMVLVAVFKNIGSQNLSSSFLDRRPWSTPPPTPSFPFSALSYTNHKKDVYPTFNNLKMQKVVEGLMKELNAESVMRNDGRERDKKMERVEAGLVKARALIRDAIRQSRHSHVPAVEDQDYVPRGKVYRNAYVFERSYLLMERLFKIYVYEEGEPPLFHSGPSKNIYSTEGIFLGLIESNTHFRTFDPDEAHAYFLPFSVVMILQYLFDPIERDKAVLQRVVGDYVGVISNKYPYWNRSFGADHFMLSCHDWGPRATWAVHKLYFTSMRVLCNANTSEFFNPRKDVSFPEINLPTGNLTGLVSKTWSNNRTILAFFAGRLHGHIRPLLFQHWKNYTGDIKVFETIPENSSLSYTQMMENSKYCLCPSGHEVASPRIVEAIYAGCVPVLISQDYVLPYSDVLDWDEFTVRLEVDKLQDLKKILMGLGENKYEKLVEGVRNVQRHFVVNDPPKRYDAFHLMIHSLWLRRLNLRVH
ncbi:LOW QUALITY PROTEIN: putative glycosyltransferase At3g07620 [Primulina tabacum]|uniref:LOW QUALITY PROTEIN: putative glycosyltransferase At3g07620 n=1 Tax=Primulina tabacum TaxID=48773 RepID=UPI003F593CE5